MGQRSTFKSIISIFALAVILAGGPLIWIHARAHAEGHPQSAGSAAATTTERDQTDLNVTVYNSNVALVRDVRQISLPAGSFPLRFEDVAASINPATVHFRSLSDPSRLAVLEQNYEYDLLDPAKLLQMYVGREVTLIRAESDNNSTKWV